MAFVMVFLMWRSHEREVEKVRPTILKEELSGRTEPQNESGE